MNKKMYVITMILNAISAVLNLGVCFLAFEWFNLIIGLVCAGVVIIYYLRYHKKFFPKKEKYKYHIEDNETENENQ